ncbi:MAG TPA: transposase [Hymenobacter sp.]|nr:transposase [Hymenobacter sp.]
MASGTALPAVFGAGRWQGGKQFFSRSMPGFVDSTTVKAHQAAAGQKSTARRECFGRSCGGLGTKVHVVVDALGNCLHLALTPAASTESPQRPALLAALAQPPGAIVCAKAYDTNNGLNTITDQRAVPVIPPKSTGWTSATTTGTGTPTTPKSSAFSVDSQRRGAWLRATRKQLYLF